MPATGRETRSERMSTGSSAASTAQLAGYIKDMVREMERLAEGPDLATLRDLLRRAREEASRHAQE